jgi:putative endonuclease
LESLGYSILERNFRHRLGEIDIVAEYEGHLVICEAKSRPSGKNRSIPFGYSGEAHQTQKTLRSIYYQAPK